MKTLPSPNDYHLAAAEGWLGLDDWQEALGEYEQIDAAWRAHPDVLQVFYLIQAAAQCWDQALLIAQQILTAYPERSFGWLQTAFTLNKLGQTREAYTTLLNALEHFPKEVLIRYNLACFASKIGNFGDAWNWLDKTFELGAPKELQDIALTDPDLRPLWDKMGASHFAPSLAIHWLAIGTPDGETETDLIGGLFNKR
jgi:tetratricopeptide (TPR) repeat protein